LPQPIPIEPAFGTRYAADLQQPQLHAPAAVTQLGSDHADNVRDLLHGAGQRAHPVAQQRAVGRIVDVGLHHRRVHAHAPTRDNALVQRDRHDPIVDLLEHPRPNRQAPPPHCLGVRHLAAAHMGKVALARTSRSRAS